MTQTNAPSGISTSMFFRLLCAAPTTAQPTLPVAVPALRRALRSSACRERYWPVTLRGFVDDLVGGADGHDFAAAHAGAGAEVDDVVGRPHRVFVVLDDDDRVAHVAQLA